MCGRQITLSKIEEISLLLISNLEPDLYNINAHTKFDENALIFPQVIVQKQKYGHVASRLLRQKLTKFAH